MTSVKEFDIDELIERQKLLGSSRKEDVDDIEKAVRESELVIEWADVKCSYAKKNEEVHTTLFNATGHLKTRELTAIMGRSGSGKSTLLDILSGRKTTGTVSGSIRIFGEEVTDMKHASKLLRDVTAFVPQDVTFFPMQTPEEAVQFVARLTHNSEDDASLPKCHEILRDVGLTNPELYKRPIGGELAGGLSVRGLSGGEQKRLALACALAMDPQLIMLDEITSGLDSENALATIQLVKKVCVTRNVSAAVIIHQPDGYIFEEFDRLVLLSKGACLFSDHVSHLGDFYQAYLKEDLPTSSHEIPLALMRKLGELDLATAATITHRKANIRPGGALTVSHMTTAKRIEHVPSWKKLRIVLHRNLTNQYLRNLTNLLARLLCFAACSFIDGSLFWGVGDKEPAAVTGALSFVTLLSFLLPFATLPVFVQEKKFFVVEKSLGLYSPWIYCVSQALLEFWVVVMTSFIQAMILIPMVQLWNPSMTRPESFFTTLSVLVAAGLCGSAPVQFFAILLPSQDLAFVINAGITSISLGMSGGFVPLTAVVDWISWLKWISFCKYALAGLVRAVVGGTEHEVLVQLLGIDQPDTVTANVGVLLAFYVLFAVASMLALSRVKPRR